MNTNKTFLGAGLIAVAAFFFWMLDLTAYDHMSLVKTTIADRQKILDERIAIVANVAKLNQEYIQRAGEIKQFSSVIPTKKDMAELVSAFEAIAGRSGLAIAEITSSPNNDANTQFTSLNIALKAKGSYSSLNTFLDGLEKNIRLVDVDSIEMAPAENQPGILDITLKTLVYSTK